MELGFLASYLIRRQGYASYVTTGSTHWFNTVLSSYSGTDYLNTSPRLYCSGFLSRDGDELEQMVRGSYLRLLFLAFRYRS